MEMLLSRRYNLTTGLTRRLRLISRWTTAQSGALSSGQQHAQAGDAAFELLELADVHHDRGEAEVVQEPGGAGSGRCDQYLVTAQRDDMAAGLFVHRADRREQLGGHQLG